VGAKIGDRGRNKKIFDHFDLMNSILRFGFQTSVQSFIRIE